MFKTFTFKKTIGDLSKTAESLLESADKMLSDFESDEGSVLSNDGKRLGIRVNVAGTDPKDIEVACNGAGVTVIFGSKKQTFCTGDALKSQDLKAVYSRGILTVTVPIYISPRILAQVEEK